MDQAERELLQVIGPLLGEIPSGGRIERVECGRHRVEGAEQLLIGDLLGPALGVLVIHADLAASPPAERPQELGQVDDVEVRPADSEQHEADEGTSYRKLDQAPGPRLGGADPPGNEVRLVS